MHSSLQTQESDQKQQIYNFQLHMAEDYQTQRVYIDPERLLRLKKERKAFKQVASIFQPPPQTAQTNSHTTSIQQLSNREEYPRELQQLKSEVLVKSRSPNVDFVVSLLGEIKPEQVVWLQQGDCLTIKSQERWLLLEGEVRVTGVGGRTFSMKQGSILFINYETQRKIREVICLKGSRVMKISEDVFQRMKNYIFLKNAQKIKYLKYCPFFIWTDQLSEDLAACMKMQVFEKGEHIYYRGDAAKQILFVKEGIVLLERFAPLANQVLKEYENHYERSQISESQSTLVVKKGMVFGIDGILLKEIYKEFETKQQQNPQSYTQRRARQQTRVYTARTLGRTEVYILEKQVLEGLFDVSDLLSANNFPRQLTKSDLQRICSDYADMVVRHRSLPKIVQAVVSKEMTLDKLNSAQELFQKKTKVRQVRQQQELTKQHSIAKIISDCRHYRNSDINNSVILQNHFSQKLGIIDKVEEQGMVFPGVSSHLKKRKTTKQNKRGENVDKYIMQWLKGDPQSKQQKKLKSNPNKKPNKLYLINVKSYRNIVPSIT